MLRFCCLIEENSWVFPHSSIWDRVEIPSNLLPNAFVDDQLIWKPAGSGLLSIKSVYFTLCSHGTLVPWSKLVWSKKNILRHSFILWLALNKKLYTLDKLSAWGVTSVTFCFFYNSSYETHEHLFFQCSFSSTVWTLVVKALNCAASFKS